MEKMQHFSIRKLSIGAASVLIGISFLGVKASTVKADSLQNTSKAELTKSKAANEVIKQDTGSNIEQEPASDIKQDTGSNIEQDADSNIKQDTSSNIEQEPVSKVDAKQITNDQPNTAQAPAKPAAPKPNSNQQNTADLEAKPQTSVKDKLQTNSTITPNKVGQPKVRVTNLMAIAGKKLNAQMLSESKVMSPTKDTNDAYALDSKNGLHEHANVNDNGGYDKDYWGAIDLNNWNYTQDVAGDITLSGYKGSDNTKIIIPNIADFAHGNVTQNITLQVNPNVDTNKVYISSDVMHDLAKNATRIGLSKTANNKVVAKDGIWQDAFGGITNEPGTTSNANGGIKYSSPNLTQMDLHNLDTTAITDMSALFNGGSNLTTVGDLSDWNTSNVINMRNMFQTASSLTNIGNLDNWDTSNVTDMTCMFNKASSLTNIGDLSKWQTGNVTDMNRMFANATNLTNIGNLNNWDTSKVTNMSWMFGTESGKQSHLTNIGDLSKWQTGNVTDMNCMFANASSLTNIGNLDNWDTSKVTDMSTMFANASSLTNIGNLDNWDTSKVTDMSWMFGTNYDKQSHLTNIGDLSKWQTGKVTDMNDMFVNATNLTNIGNLSKWQTGNITNMSYMFDNATNLTNIGNLNNWDTSEVTNMNSMFDGASGLTSLDVSKWKTGNVTDMSWMFYNASGLTSLDVSNWNTGNVTNMNLMFDGASSLTSLDVSKWDTSKVTDMSYMFDGASNLTSLDVSNWNTGKVTNMNGMFNSASGLKNLDVSKWNTGKVTDMSWMFSNASNLKTLDVSKWDTSKVTDMSYMFDGASNLTSLDVSNWDANKVTDMYAMFNNNPKLALTVNGDKFADYLVKNNFADSRINSGVKSVTTDNTKLLQLLTNDSQHDSSTRTIVLTFPAGYSPDLTKYHLTKTGNTYQIKQSVDYDKPYLQGTVLINATKDITEHHIDTTKPNKLSDTWQPNYDKLVLAHKNSDGSVSFDAIQLPKVPGYKARINNPNMMLFSVSFMALPKPVTPVQNDAKPAETVSPATPVAIEVAKPIKTEPKATTPKVIDLSDDAVATTPKEITWQVANEQDTYRVSNGQYTVELPHISNAQLHVVANDSTKDSVLFTYKGQNTKYVFNIKFVNGHYLLTTYKVKSGKLVKLINYNFIKSSKMIDVILDWINLK